MKERFRTLRLLSTVFLVFAWMTVAWAMYSLFTAQIEDEKYYDVTINVWRFQKAGIGVMGAIAIVVDAALRFLLLLGASQAIKLWLEIDGSISDLGRRLADLNLAVTEVRVQQTKTSEQVRMVGSIVYEEAKKED